MKKLSILALVAGIAMIAGLAVADVPAPPVNQTLGFPDTEFNALTEADCRVCHDSGVNDDHHLLYGSAMIGPGACSAVTGTCSVTTGTECVVDDDCPVGETCVANDDTCYVNSECETYTNLCTRGEPCGTCSVTTGQECGVDDDCPIGETCDNGCPRYHGVQGQCGQPICEDGSMAPNNPNDGVYGCLSCHNETNDGGVIGFEVINDCMVCHEYRGGATVHHEDNSVTGARAGICNTCHGDLVDNIVGCDPVAAAGNCSDTNLVCVTDADCTSPATCVPATCDHVIPTYDPSLVTPHPAGGEEGTCDFCHAPGIDTDTGTIVYNQHDTHHHAGGTTFGECNWCHQDGRPGNGPPETEIRTCENCHGYASLHNIQADSPAAGNIGTIVVGGEDYGYGHIGIDDPAGDSDCWGCHAFSAPSIAGMGSGVPTIGNAVPASITAGTPTQVTVTGAALISEASDSDVRLTAADGSSLTITPDSITGDVLTVTINAAAGSYSLQAVKDGEASNSVAFSVMPQVAITDMDCSKCLSTMTITGSGFAVKPAGTDEDISVTEDGRPLNVIDWSDTEITVSGTRCRGDVVVNGVYGSSQ